MKDTTLDLSLRIDRFTGFGKTLQAIRAGNEGILSSSGNPKLVGKSAIVPKDSNYAYASYLKFKK